MKKHLSKYFMLIPQLILLFYVSLGFAQVRFEGLGDLPAGAVSSAAYGVSADGSVVVGWSRGTKGTEVFRMDCGHPQPHIPLLRE